MLQRVAKFNEIIELQYSAMDIRVFEQLDFCVRHFFQKKQNEKSKSFLRFKVNIGDYNGFKIILIKQKITSMWFRASICF